MQDASKRRRKSFKAHGKQPEPRALQGETTSSGLAAPVAQSKNDHQKSHKRKRKHSETDFGDALPLQMRNGTGQDEEVHGESEDEMATGVSTSATSIHRIRFVDHQPKAAITGLAVCPLTWRGSSSSGPSRIATQSSYGTLAVGRENGNIEIYNWLGDSNQQASDTTEEEDGKGPSKIKTSSKTTKRTHSRIHNDSKQAYVLSRTLHGPVPIASAEHVTFVHRTRLTDDELDLCDSTQEAELEILKLRKQTPRLFSTAGGSEVWEWHWYEDTSSPSREEMLRLGGSSHHRRSHFHLGQIKDKVALPGGSICDMQPNTENSLLATCADDGSIHLISLTTDELVVVRTFERASNVRLLSLSWGPPVAPLDSDEYGSQRLRKDAYLVTGCADSTIRKWNTVTGRVSSKMTLEKADHRSHTFVWAVTVLNDHVIISGDSLGSVRFWDGQMDVQTRAYRSHRSDVLCIAVAADGNTIYTSGSDQRTCQFAKTRHNQRSGDKMRDRWMLANTRRVHCHDVRTMICSPSYSQGAPEESAVIQSGNPNLPKAIQLLISGGLDMSLVQTPCQTITHAPHTDPSTVQYSPLGHTNNVSFQSGACKRISPLQQTQVLSHARQAGMILLRRESSFTLWRFSKSDKEYSNPSVSSSWDRLADMTLKNLSSTLTICDLSDDGHWVIAGDTASLRLWSIKMTTDGCTLSPCQSFRQLTARIGQGAARPFFSTAAFAPDSSTLLIGLAADPSNAEDSSASTLRAIKLPRNSQELCKEVFNASPSRNAIVNARAMAGKAQMINGEAKAKGVNGSSRPHSDDASDSESEQNPAKSPQSLQLSSVRRISFDIEGKFVAIESEKGLVQVLDAQSYVPRCLLPSLQSDIVDIDFLNLPASTAVIVVLSNDHHLFFYNISSRIPPKWASQVTRDLSSLLRENCDQLVGMRTNSSTEQSSKILCWSHRHLYLLNLDVGLDKKALKAPWKTVSYADILHADFTTSGDLLAVQRPFEDMLAHLPPAFFAATYGNA